MEQFNPANIAGSFIQGRQSKLAEIADQHRMQLANNQEARAQKQFQMGVDEAAMRKAAGLNTLATQVLPTVIEQIKANPQQAEQIYAQANQSLAQQAKQLGYSDEEIAKSVNTPFPGVQALEQVLGRAQTIEQQMKNREIKGTVTADGRVKGYSSDNTLIDMGAAPAKDLNFSPTSSMPFAFVQQTPSGEFVGLNKGSGQMEVLPNPSGAKGSKSFDTETKLRSEFADASKNYTATQRTASNLGELAKVGTPQSDVAMVFSFGKMLDQDSAVRESEYKLFESARGIGDTLQNLVPKLVSGQRLTPEQREQMVEIANRYSEVAKKAQQAKEKQYSGLAKNYGVSDSNVITTNATDDANDNDPNRPLTPQEMEEYKALGGK